MSDAIEARLKELAITLPQAAAPAANYVPYVISGNLLYLSGQLPIEGLGDGDAIVEAVGLVWSTSLRTDAAGHTLAVQSCGEAACRTRVLDLRSGDVRRLGSADDGTMVGVGDGWLIGFSACKGLPCRLTATAIADGRQRVLATSAWSATTTVRAGRMVVLAVAGAHDGPEQQLIDPADGRTVRRSSSTRCPAESRRSPRPTIRTR